MSAFHALDNLPTLIHRIRLVSASHSRREIPLGEWTPSAVLIPLFAKEERSHVLFAKRTLTVRHHKGQISFPGGAADGQDESLMETALREAEEEIGLRASDVTVLAELDDLVTPTGFRITPFVGVIPYPYSFRLNHHETAELIEVPVTHLLSPSHHRIGYRRHQNRVHEIHYFDFEGHTIWGATGNILYALLNKIGSSDATSGLQTS